MAQPMVYLMITGVEELNQKLVNLRRSGQTRAMKYAFKEPMRLITRELKQAAPKVKGVLQRSIAWRMLNRNDAGRGTNKGKGPGGEEVVFFAKAGGDVSRKQVPAGEDRPKARHAHLVSLGTTRRERQPPVGFTGAYGTGKHGIRGKYWIVELRNLQLINAGWSGAIAQQNRGTGKAKPRDYVQRTEQRLMYRVQNMIEARFETAIEAEWKKQNP